MTRSVLANMQTNAPDLASMKDRFQKISDALTEVGLAVESSVTGQINIASLTYPASLVAGTYYQQGFEVRKLVQAGLPTLYVRIDYQVFARQANTAEVCVALRINVGTAVSSAGVLTGSRPSSGQSHVPGGTPPTGSLPVVIASDGKNYLTILIGYQTAWASNTAGFFAYGLERTRDRSSGLFDAEGLLVVYPICYGSLDSLTAAPTVSGRVVTLNLTTTLISATTSIYFASIGVGWGTTSSGTGDAATICPLPVGLPKLKAVSSLVFGYWRDEIAVGSEFNITIYGTTIRLIAVGGANNLSDAANGAVMRTAIRCD